MQQAHVQSAEAEAGSAVEKADIEVTAELAKHRDHPAMKLASRLSELGDQPPLFALGGAVLALGLLRRSGREVEAGLRMLAAEALATFIKGEVKKRVARTRPFRMLERGEYRAEADAPNDKAEQSFPSGHTAGAVAVAGVLAPMYPGAAAPLFGVAGAIAAVQPLRAAHYLADVAAGAVVGAASAVVVNLAADRIKAALKG